MKILNLYAGIGIMGKDKITFDGLVNGIYGAAIGLLVVNIVYQLVHERTGISMDDLREEGVGICDQLKAQNMKLI